MATLTPAKKLRGICEALRKNDPALTELDLSDYGKLEWKDAAELAEALDCNTSVMKLVLNTDEDFICSDGALQFHHFLRSSERLREMALLWDGSNDNGTSVALEALSRNKFLTKLVIWNTDGLKRPDLLEKVLTKMASLREIRFCQDVLAAGSITRECTRALHRGLENNTTLEAVVLQSTELVLQPTFVEVLYGLSGHTKLKKLTVIAMANPALSQTLKLFLKSCQILESVSLDLSLCRTSGDGSAAFTSILDGLSSNRSITTVNLKLPADTIPCAAAFTDTFRINTTIKTFRVHPCTLNLECASAIAHGLRQNVALRVLGLDDSLQVGALEILDLSSFTLNSGGCSVILNGLRENKVLKELCLGGNNISIDGSCATAVKEFLKCTRTQKLFFDGNTVTSEGMTELVAGLTENTTLTELDLESCELDTDGLLILAEGLETNKTLETLDLCENGFDKDGLCGFFELLPKMKGLKDLCFDASLLDERVGLKLKEGLKGNKSLYTIESVNQSGLPTDVKDSIEFYLKMNRNGRRFLQESKDEDVVPLPFGAWPLILARMTSPSEHDELFHFLRHKGDLLQ